MAKQTLNRGTNPNDGSGDSLRSAAAKINANTDELYNAFGDGNELLNADVDFGSNKIFYSNVVSLESDLDDISPAVYHGMVVHAHSTGALYYAHQGKWRKLLTDTSHDDVTSASYTDPLSLVAYSGDFDDLTNAPTVPSNIEELANVSTNSPTVGQVLEWNGTLWTPSSVSGGGGIELTDISVTQNNASGAGSLTYNSVTGVFTYTPPSLTTYLENMSEDTSPSLGGDLDTAGSNIRFGDGSATPDANRLFFGADSDLRIQHSQSLGINEIHYTNDLIITGDADTKDLIVGSGGAGNPLFKNSAVFKPATSVDLYYNNDKKFETTATGVRTTGTISVNNAYTLPIIDGSVNQVLATDGNGVLGFVNQSGGGATDIEDLANVSTTTPSTGQVLKWDGAQWAPATDLTSDPGSGIALTDLSVSTGTAGTAALAYNDTTGVFTFTPPDLSSYLTSVAFGDLSTTPTTLSGYGITDAATSAQGALADSAVQPADLGNFTFTSNTLSTSGAAAITVTPDVTFSGSITIGSLQSTGVGNLGFTSAASVNLTAADDINLTATSGSVVLGGDLDTNGNTVKYTFTLGANGISDYTFSDAGNVWFPTTENDPVLYLRRGETYVFTNNSGGSHPFEIRVSNGGAAYSTGVTNNAAPTGDIIFSVPMSAPSTLYYQCTVHGGMGNTINIV